MGKVGRAVRQFWREGERAVSRLFIDRFDKTQLNARIREALTFVNAETIITPSTRVFIKPNLTWRTPTPGVTVQPAFIAALVAELRQYTSHLTIGESEGGQACF